MATEKNLLRVVSVFATGWCANSRPNILFAQCYKMLRIKAQQWRTETTPCDNDLLPKAKTPHEEILYLFAFSKNHEDNKRRVYGLEGLMATKISFGGGV